MQTQSNPKINVLLKYPPLTFLVIGQLGMETLYWYPLMINKYQFCILGLYSKHSLQKILPFNHCWRIPFPAEFIFWTLFQYQWIINFCLPYGFSLKLNVTGLVRSPERFSCTSQEKVHLHQLQSFLGAWTEQISFQNAILRPGLM